MLHSVYDAQRSFQNEHKRYASSLAELGLTDLSRESLPTLPQVEAAADRFQANVEVRLPDGKPERWHFREDSRIWSDR